MTIRPIRCMPALALLLLLPGCADVQSEIVGSWRGVTLAQDLDIGADGRTRLDDRKHGTYDGSCRVDESNVLTCHFERFSRPVVRDVEIRGDTMVLTDGNGREERYERAG